METNERPAASVDRCDTENKGDLKDHLGKAFPIFNILQEVNAEPAVTLDQHLLY